MTYATGTITSTSLSGTSLSVTDTSKSWSSSQWVTSPPYSVVDISITDFYGAHPGAEIDSSTSNNISSTTYDAWNGGAGATPFNNGDTYQILRASACIDQAGHGGNGATLLSGVPTPTPTGWVNEPLDPIYEWGDTSGNTPIHGWLSPNATNLFVANHDYYQQVSQSAQSSPSSPFSGASGTGYGTIANRPTTCTTGVGYWATDQGSWNQSGSGGQGQLYVCTSTNTWTLYYTPYTYPHPLANTTTVITPTASPVQGIYASAQSVTLSDATSGATICYTVDGTTPAASTPGTCSHGSTYSSAISVSVSTVIRAIGTKTGLVNSSLFIATYVISAITPSISISRFGCTTCRG